MAEDREFLSKQLELYSNAVVSYTVVQALAYTYAFATSCPFNHAVKTAPYLAEMLTALLGLIAVFATAALVYLGRQLVKLYPAHRSLLQVVYRSKAVAAGLINAVPIYVTVAFAVLSSDPNPACH